MSQISRRSFLKTSAVGGVLMGMTAVAHTPKFKGNNPLHLLFENV